MSSKRKIAAAQLIGYQRTSRRVRPLSGGRIYVACPVSEFSTPRYERLAAMVRRQFPGAVILEARDLYTSHVDWRNRWPATLESLTHLIFFCDPEGWIGRGVWKEITDAVRNGVTVLHLSERGRLTPRAALLIGPPNEECWQRYCRVALSETER